MIAEKSFVLAEDQRVKFVKPVFALAIFATLVGSQFWSFQGIPNRILDVLEILVSGSLIALVILNLKRSHWLRAKFSGNVILFMALPLLSSFGAALFHDQEIQLSLLLFKTIYFWLLYFVLHIYQVPTKWIVKFMLMVGLIWIAITIVQQFTYPNFIFYTRGGDNSEILRAGVYRFMIDPQFYGLFVVVYFYDRYLDNLKLTNLILVALGLVGYYYFGTRQYAVGVVICMMIASLMRKGSRGTFAVLFFFSVAFFIVLFKDALFKSYIDMTSEQFQSDDDIRLLAAQFFLMEYWPHWLTFIFGNGEGHEYAAYGGELRYYKEYYGYYRSDIGIVGVLNSFGIVYVINIIHSNIKGLQNKFYTENTRYLKLFFINFLLLLFLSVDYAMPRSIPFFCFIFYLVDKSFELKKKHPIQTLNITPRLEYTLHER